MGKFTTLNHQMEGFPLPLELMPYVMKAMLGISSKLLVRIFTELGHTH